MNPKPFSLLKNFTVPVAISYSLSFFLLLIDLDMLLGARGAGPGTGRHLLELLTAWGCLTDFPISTTERIVAPSDQPLTLTDIVGVLIAQRDVRQDHRDRILLIARIQTPRQGSARWLDHDCHRIAAKGANGFRSRG